MRDLTAVLTRISDHDADGESVKRAVMAGGYGDVWLRVKPLDKIGLLQIELCDANGLPRVDPALVHALSKEGKRAAFVHVNHEAKQAVIHCFHDGAQLEGWVGEPDGVEPRLMGALGRTLEEITGADDGTREGIGVTASATAAIVRGRTLVVPVGLPTTAGSFSFSDRGRGHDTGDRVALVALDLVAARASWEKRPGAELAAELTALPDGVLGPLKELRGEVVKELAELGDRSPAAGGLRSLRAFELCALAEARVHAVGESVAWIGELFLPMFALSTAPPVLDDEDADELEALPSILSVMVEVLPFASPEGSLLPMVADSELVPLAPWIAPGEEYVGALFGVSAAGAERLRHLVCDLQPMDMAARVDVFYRHWWKGSFEGTDAAFLEWRDGFDKKGATELQRFLHAWAGWRTCLELAKANGLQVALLFYSGTTESLADAQDA